MVIPHRGQKGIRGKGSERKAVECIKNQETKMNTKIKKTPNYTILSPLKK